MTDKNFICQNNLRNSDSGQEIGLELENNKKIYFTLSLNFQNLNLPVDDIVKVRNETLSNEGSYKHIPSVD